MYDRKYTNSFYRKDADSLGDGHPSAWYATTKYYDIWGFPGGPVVKTSPSNDVGSMHDQEAKIPQA